MSNSEVNEKREVLDSKDCDCHTAAVLSEVIVKKMLDGNNAVSVQEESDDRAVKGRDLSADGREKELTEKAVSSTVKTKKEKNDVSSILSMKKEKDEAAEECQVSSDATAAAAAAEEKEEECSTDAVPVAKKEADGVKVATENTEKVKGQDSDLADIIEKGVKNLHITEAEKEGNRKTELEKEDKEKSELDCCQSNQDNNSVCFVTIQEPESTSVDVKTDLLTDEFYNLSVEDDDNRRAGQVRSHGPMGGVAVPGRNSSSGTIPVREDEKRGYMYRNAYPMNWQQQPQQKVHAEQRPLHHQNFIGMNTQGKRGRDCYDDQPAAIYRRPDGPGVGQNQINMSSTVKMSGGTVKIHSPTAEPLKTGYPTPSTEVNWNEIEKDFIEMQFSPRQGYEGINDADAVRPAMMMQQHQQPLLPGHYHPQQTAMARRHHLDSEGQSIASSSPRSCHGNYDANSPRSNYDVNRMSMSPLSDYDSAASPDSDRASPKQNDLSSVSICSPGSVSCDSNLAFDELSQQGVYIPEQKILNTDSVCAGLYLPDVANANNVPESAYRSQGQQRQPTTANLLQYENSLGGNQMSNSGQLMNMGSLDMAVGQAQAGLGSCQRGQYGGPQVCDGRQQMKEFDEVLKSVRMAGAKQAMHDQPTGVSSNVVERPPSPEYNFTKEEIEELSFVERSLNIPKQPTKVASNPQTTPAASRERMCHQENNDVAYSTPPQHQVSLSLQNCAPAAAPVSNITTSCTVASQAPQVNATTSQPAPIINIVLIPPTNTTDKVAPPRRPVRPIRPKPMQLEEGKQENQATKSTAGVGKTMVTTEHQQESAPYMKNLSDEPIEKHPSFIKASRLVANVPREKLLEEDEVGDNCLHISVCKEDPHMLFAILSRFKRENIVELMVNKPNNQHQTPVYLAVVSNKPIMVKKLIECGADVNIQALDHQKLYKGPLHYAAAQGRKWLPVLHTLLEAKNLSLGKTNSEGLTALHCAVTSHGSKLDGETIDCWPIVNLLVKRGASLAQKDHKSGKSVLHHIIEKKDMTLIRRVLNFDLPDMGDIVNSKAYNGNTCLHIAAGLPGMKNIEDHIEIIKLLLAKGADPNIANSEGQIPRRLCNGNSKLVEALAGRTSKPTTHVAPQPHPVAVPIQNIPVTIVTTQGVPFSVPSPLPAQVPVHNAASPRGSSTIITETPIAMPTHLPPNVPLTTLHGVTMATPRNSNIQPVMAQQVHGNVTAMYSSPHKQPQITRVMPAAGYVVTPVTYK